MNLGPNHRDGCTGEPHRYSGDGYNRVRICGCGAEDHAPVIDDGKFQRMLDEMLELHALAEVEEKRDAKDGAP